MMDTGMDHLYRPSSMKSRSITAENPTGEPGRGGMADIDPNDVRHPARELGHGWKVRPYITIEPGQSVTIARIEGPGILRHLWMTTFPAGWRELILRMYWDEEEAPSVEAPIGDFFLNGWCERSNVHSAPISVNPAGGFNSYFPMPFRRSARIVIENLGVEERMFFYQIDYVLGAVASDAAYFHASFRRENPVAYLVPYTILDGVEGKGQYVGTYAAWQVNSNNWWGEGEVKFYLDDDEEYPTICGTGTEDYFGGAWNFEEPKGQYGQFSNLYHGLHQVIKPDGLYRANQRFGMYRFHIHDPIYFEKRLKVTMQALGWRSDGRFLPLRDDIATVAYWYQTEPHAPFPALPERNGLEVI
jgi:hypothetical protein